jgi:predicted transcriptional regulator
LFYTPSHINSRAAEDKNNMSESATSPNYIELCSDIVSAYVSNNSVQAADLPSLLQSVYAALTKTAQGQQEEPKAELVPAVSVRKSVTPDYIICLEDGKKFKSLKRHLRSTYDMTPEQYRAKWNLPADYPMVAPNYAKARSELAKTMGLGQQRKKSTALTETTANDGVPAKPKRAAAKAAVPSEEVTARAKGRRTKKTA